VAVLVLIQAIILVTIGHIFGTPRGRIGTSKTAPEFQSGILFD
jgi:hypothetical protein